MVTRKLRLTRTFELWRSHIKQVEGHFGTAVASYFVLLRWLFYMNMAIFVVWTLFVSIPQFVLERPSIVQATNSCIYRNATGYTYNCPRRSTAVYLINCTVENSTVATLCTNSSVAATVVPKYKDVYTSSHNYCNISSAFLQEWSLCSNSTRTTGTPGFLDLVTGRGALTNTWLFLGHYSNLTEYNGISYNRPVAILVCTAVVYGISFVMIIIRYVYSHVAAKEGGSHLCLPSQHSTGLQCEQCEVQPHHQSQLLQQSILCLGLQDHRHPSCETEESVDQNRTAGILIYCHQPSHPIGPQTPFTKINPYL